MIQALKAEQKEQKQKTMVLFWVTIFLINVFAFIVPKHIPYWQMYATSAFAVMFQLFVDIYLDLKLDLYGYFNKGVDELGFVYEFGIFPASSIIFLNFWAALKGFWPKSIYLFACVNVATFYEYLALKSGYLYYNGWKLWYSFLEYPLLFMILIGNWHLLQRLHQRSA
jgi:hypothetical protein